MEKSFRGNAVQRHYRFLYHLSGDETLHRAEILAASLMSAQLRLPAGACVLELSVEDEREGRGDYGREQ